MLGLVRGNDEGWGSPVIVSLLVGADVLLAAFVAIERRVREPMLPLSLFRRRAFTGVQLSAFAVSGSMFALFLYLQSYLGYSPVEAGLRYLPITIASFIVAPVAGLALARVQARSGMAAGINDTFRQVGIAAWGRSSSALAPRRRRKWPATRSAATRLPPRPQRDPPVRRAAGLGRCRRIALDDPRERHRA